MSNLTADERRHIIVPQEAWSRCSRPGCPGQFAPILDSVSADEGDGSAMVDTECDRQCGMSSYHGWPLPDDQYRNVFNHEFGDYPDDEDD